MDRDIGAQNRKRKARRAMLEQESASFMASSVRLEICVESLDHALAAESGGADRIELCQNLSLGGVSPMAELLRAVRNQVRIPIHSMIRPRAGDFTYTESEFEMMKRDIDVARDLRLDGLVLGVLDSNGQVDRERTMALVELAQPLPVTFHRAFDQCPDLSAALEAVIASGPKRILTSGGAVNATAGLTNLASLMRSAADRIVIMPGGGVRADNVEQILRATGAREIHSSLGISDPQSRLHEPALFEEEVWNFKRALQMGS
jgi:copper homeostasis protein